MRDRVACVTGANSGIGFSVAKSFAKRECTVHMICRNQARGEEARSLISEETGNDDVHLHVVDVSDFRQVRGEGACPVGMRRVRGACPVGMRSQWSCECEYIPPPRPQIPGLIHDILTFITIILGEKFCDIVRGSKSVT